MALVVTARVIGVRFEILNIDWMRSTGNDDLMLVIIEHSEPLQVNNVGQAFGENGELRK